VKFAECRAAARFSSERGQQERKHCRWPVVGKTRNAIRFGQVQSRYRFACHVWLTRWAFSCEGSEA
jgi:hypothetical protein